jgi:hypothetical protein
VSAATPSPLKETGRNAQRARSALWRRHLDHWLQAEHELVAENALDFEFKQLMRAFRSGIISETAVEQVMTDLEKRALPVASEFRAGWATLSTEVKI